MKKLIITSALFLIGISNWGFGQVEYTGTATVLDYWSGTPITDVSTEMYYNDDTLYLVSATMNMPPEGFRLTTVYLTNGPDSYNVTSTRGGQYSPEGSYLKNTKQNGDVYYAKVMFHYDMASIDSPEEINFSIHPNPVTDVIQIVIQQNEAAKVTVSDIQGRAVYTQQVTGSCQVDMTNEPCGAYFVKVGTVTRKFIKQ